MGALSPAELSSSVVLQVRNEEWVGVTGKPLKDVVAIGIGGSFLGPLFVHNALRTDQEAAEESRGRQLRFLANVDPIDVARALNGLDAETTLIVVVSKTFTTAETMLNARTVRPRLLVHHNAVLLCHAFHTCIAVGLELVSG
jgi:glucose-6-phosphate isomerase